MTPQETKWKEMLNKEWHKKMKKYTTLTLVPKSDLGLIDFWKQQGKIKTQYCYENQQYLAILTEKGRQELINQDKGAKNNAD